jgi:hypothetical protein
MVSALADSCVSCYYFKRESKSLGECRRHPKPQTKFCTYWCGEFLNNLYMPEEHRVLLNEEKS